MSLRHTLLRCLALCCLVVGCGDDDKQDLQGNNAPEPAVHDRQPVVRKPKKKESPKVSSKKLRDYLPQSLSVAVGAKLAAVEDIATATGTDFITELRPVTKLLTKAGIVVEEIDELWVGSNPGQSETAICVRTKKDFDRDKMRTGLLIAEPLGKVDGAELHALQPEGNNENAVAFIDSQTFMVGRRSTLEAGLKRPSAGAVRKGLAVAATPDAAYWVGGDSHSYLQQLAHHGFPEFATNIGTSAPPTGFALSIQMELPAEEESKSRRQPVVEDLAPVAIAMGFEFESERAALGMERRVRDVLTAIGAKIQAEANLESTLSQSGQSNGKKGGPATGKRNGEKKSSRKKNRGTATDEHDMVRPQDPLEGLLRSPLQQAVPEKQFFLRRGDDDEEEDDDDDDRRGFGRGKIKVRPKRTGFQVGNRNRSGQSEIVNFEYTVKREAAKMRVTVIFDLRPERTSVVAAVVRVTGNSLTGTGFSAGGDPAIIGGLAAWRSEQKGPLHGVKRLPDLPVVVGYSWMTELLPFLGQQNVYVGFDFSKDWMSHPENRRLAGTLIPEFLDPAAGNAKWNGYPFAGLGLTHFVGMAGVEDSPNVVAAALPRSDPRAGIFGYDDIAKPKDITDGATNTIMMIGAGRLAGPWVQGGGATIRGARAPHFDEVSGFGSPGLKNRGARVLFADGSSREISAEIDPDVFRALCTIHGGESVDLNRINMPTKQTTAVDPPTAKK